MVLDPLSKLFLLKPPIFIIKRVSPKNASSKLTYQSIIARYFNPNPLTIDMHIYAVGLAQCLYMLGFLLKAEHAWNSIN